MAEARSSAPCVTLLFGLLANDESLFDAAETVIGKEFSPIIERSAVIPFEQTDYYADEMGPRLWRRWVAVENLLEADWFPFIKIATNRIEKLWAVERDGGTCRNVNIDPGWLDSARVVLATCKDRDHRIYLKNGIYAEVTLSYRKPVHRYEPHPWTYPDYTTPAAQEFFLRLRESHPKRLENWKPKVWG